MILSKEIGNKGILIGLTILLLWFFVFVFALSQPLSSLGYWAIPLVVLLMELFTGVFITAHDAIHGVVYPADEKINRLIGVIGASLFAFNSYDVMYKNHHAHHQHNGEDHDPDFHASRKFIPWFYSFIRHYIGWKQFLLTTIFFNFLWFGLKIDVANLLLFYVLPMCLSTVQLFYFGTFQPHSGIHNNRHKSGTQKKNHLWAFVSCYFFGYHYEHHDNPAVPWWRMYKTK
jgi:beta-carotene ketolase (CrtW type)